MLWPPRVDTGMLQVSWHPQEPVSEGETMNTANSVALVSGANRGIGRAFVEALLSKGARRIYAAARNVALLEPLVALDRARIIPLKIDITNREQAQTAAEVASDVNLLINNAGVLASGSLLLSDIE